MLSMVIIVVLYDYNNGNYGEKVHLTIVTIYCYYCYHILLPYIVKKVHLTIIMVTSGYYWNSFFIILSTFSVELHQMFGQILGDHPGGKPGWKGNPGIILAPANPGRDLKPWPCRPYEDRFLHLFLPGEMLQSYFCQLLLKKYGENIRKWHVHRVVVDPSLSWKESKARALHWRGAYITGTPFQQDHHKRSKFLPWMSLWCFLQLEMQWYFWRNHFWKR